MSKKWVDQGATWSDEMEKYAEGYRAKWREHASNIDFDPFGPSAEDLEDNPGDMEKRIQQLFTDFASGDRPEIQSTIDALDKAMACLGREAEMHLDMVPRRLANWEGDAADNFSDYLVEVKYKAVLAMQDRIVAAKHGMMAYQDLLHGFRKSILDLIQAADEAFQKEEDAEQKIGVGIVSAVVAVSAAALAIAAAPATGGLSIAAATGAIGSAMAGGYSGSAILAIGGENELAVIASLVDKGEKLIADLKPEVQKIEAGFSAVVASVTNAADKKLPDVRPDRRLNLKDVRPDRPDVVSDTTFDPDDFHHDDQSKDVSDRVNKDDLVEEPGKDADQEGDHYIGDGDVDGRHRDPKERERDDYPEQGPKEAAQRS